MHPRAHAHWLAAILTITTGQAAGLEMQSAYDCLIEPHSIVEISTREEGLVEEVLVKRGDAVKKGQVLVQLESEVEKLAVQLAELRADMRAQIEAKEASAAYLKAQHKRLADLYEKKAVPFHEKHKAETDAILAAAELRDAKDELDVRALQAQQANEILNRRTIRSTVDGVVVQILLEPGESVEDRPIIVIAEVDPLNVEIILSEQEYGSIDIGSKAEVTPLLPNAKPREAVVTVVDRIVDAASNTFGVRLEMPNPDYAIPGGVRCEIRFL